MIYRLTILFFLFVSCSHDKNEIEKIEVTEGIFNNVNSEYSGIEFANNLETQSNLNIIEYLYYYNGGGVAVGDINNDGLDDIYLSANERPDKLYLNLGDLKFKDITDASGISQNSTWSTGVTMADVNNDGLLDIYVCKLGDYKGLKANNELYINQGDTTFVEKAAEFGLHFSGFSTQASFFDYDNDGDLDMYLLNHSVHTPRAYGKSEIRLTSDSLAGDKLFENKMSEKKGIFVDVTKQAGIYNSPLGYGLAIATSDVNNDGNIDIYIGNDFHENDYLYINNGNKTFTESSENYFNHTSRFTMGVDIADIDNNNTLDIVTLDMMPYEPDIFLKSAGEDSDKVDQIKKAFGFNQQYARNHLQLNTGAHFVDVALVTETHATDWSWSPLLVDVDNNGYNDLFITNGIYKRPNDLDYVNYLSNIDFSRYSLSKIDSLEMTLIESMPMINLPNALFVNNGNLNFKKTAVENFNTSSYSNGAAYSDFDLDGDIDIIVNNLNDKATLLENKTSQRTDANFLSVNLTNPNFNETLLNSKVYVFSDNKSMYKELTTTKGFMSSSTRLLHFGLDSQTKVDSVIVLWPDKTKSVIKDVLINSKITIEKNNFKAFNYPITTKDSLTTFNYVHKENKYLDYEIEPLIPENLSLEGPSVAQADFNGDGLKDLFIGGAKNQSPILYLQKSNGEFSKIAIPDFSKDAIYEDIDAIAFDIDNDGDLDIYALSGGNEMREGDRTLEDRVYLNDGKANFSKLDSNMLTTNGGSVSHFDFDGDGFQDLFIGNRSIPGAYGLSPLSYILRNKGDYTFEVIEKKRFGMVTDSKWADLNNDGTTELIIVGDWMPITILSYNQKAKAFEDKTSTYGLDKSHGLWNTIKIVDLNNDGKLDILGGNTGLNFKWKASKDKPIKMYLDDFDNNGQLDQYIFYNFNGSDIPFASKDKLVQQVPSLKKKFLSYNTFSNVRSIEHLTEKNVEDMLGNKYIYELRSLFFLNQGESFKVIPLSLNAQLSSIEDFLVDGDAILATGNYFGYVTELGESSSNSGFVMSSYTDKEIKSLNLPKSFSGRKIIKLKNDNYLVLGNDGPSYRIKLKK